MAIEGVNEWEEKKKKGLMSDESFHLDQSKTEDPGEKLFDELGPRGAFDELVNQLPPDTNPDVIRQMKLVLNKTILKSQH